MQTGSKNRSILPYPQDWLTMQVAFGEITVYFSNPANHLDDDFLHVSSEEMGAAAGKVSADADQLLEAIAANSRCYSSLQDLQGEGLFNDDEVSLRDLYSIERGMGYHEESIKEQLQQIIDSFRMKDWEPMRGAFGKISAYFSDPANHLDDDPLHVSSWEMMAAAGKLPAEADQLLAATASDERCYSSLDGLQDEGLTNDDEVSLRDLYAAERGTGYYGEGIDEQVERMADSFLTRDVFQFYMFGSFAAERYGIMHIAAYSFRGLDDLHTGALSFDDADSLTKAILTEADDETLERFKRLSWLDRDPSNRNINALVKAILATAGPHAVERFEALGGLYTSAHGREADALAKAILAAADAGAVEQFVVLDGLDTGAQSPDADTLVKAMLAAGGPLAVERFMELAEFHTGAHSRDGDALVKAILAVDGPRGVHHFELLAGLDTNTGSRDGDALVKAMLAAADSHAAERFNEIIELDTDAYSSDGDALAKATLATWGAGNMAASGYLLTTGQLYGLISDAKANAQPAMPIEEEIATHEPRDARENRGSSYYQNSTNYLMWMQSLYTTTIR